ncbi:MAG: hypothetical protein CMH52_04005 [Myxococcales bacterium]|nr:hypothetical protein [Myxococcales bacterium]
MNGGLQLTYQRTELFAVCPPGLETWTADEIKGNGFKRVQIEVGGVSFVGHPISANLTLRCPTRILQRVGRFPAPTFQALERGFKKLELDDFGGLTAHVSCSKSRLYHSDAVKDRVNRWVNQGSTELYVRIHRDRCTVSIDTSGERLHRRGWRLETGPAPLRETLASLLLRVAGWTPGIALVDPMCGSGTFPIEAALRAADIPPGMGRQFECEKWCKKQDQPRVLKAVPTLILGRDRNQDTIDIAQRNTERAGVNPSLETLDTSRLKAPVDAGLLICNPPYGRRAKNPRAYDQLGLLLSTEFKTWSAGIIVSSPRALSALKRPPSRVVPISNGGLKLNFVVMEPEGQ